jgi:hypothetical protein
MATGVMPILSLIRRNWRKPPGYLARRAVELLLRRARARSTLRGIRAISAGTLPSDMSGTPAIPLYSPEDRAAIRRLYDTVYRNEREVLMRRFRQVLDHEFDLLGSGPVRLGPDIDWHRDFKSGLRWDLRPVGRLDYADLGRPSDVKIPWELSRGHHLLTLGQAWVVFGDPEAPAEFERQVRSWIGANPPGLGVNWAVTMEVSIRAVNWIWAASMMSDAPFSADFRGTLAAELYRHARWIAEHLEWSHVNGNHFDAGALGMIACGAFFRTSSRGRKWMRSGADLLEMEILLQVESDGVDIEASIQYHRLVLEIFLTAMRLLDAAGENVSGDYRDRLAAMFDYVHGYVPDGGPVPVVGDADNGRVVEFSGIPWTAHKYLLSAGAAVFGRGDWKDRAGGFWEDALWLLGPGARDRFEAIPASPDPCSKSYPVSGHYVFRGPRQYMFVDAAPVGFRGLGGHGHNDCLSFEWHAFDKPLLTDSGLFVYTASPEWRNRFRATAAHNTIRVDGEEINRFLVPETLWFLGNDAEPTETRFWREGEKELLTGGHRGYHRLPDPVTVSRRFEFATSGTEVRIVDRLDGRQEHLVEFFFHAAPGADGVAENGRTVGFSWADGVAAQISQEAGPELRLEIREGWYAPSYGVRVARQVVVASARIRLPIEVTWRLVARQGRGVPDSVSVVES